MTDTKTPTRRTTSAGSRKTWTDEERAAMQEGARERKAAPRAGSAEERAQGELDVQEKIAGMPDHDRALGKRVHEIVLASAPDLVPKTYYGMPAYAKDGKVICFFKPASKFKVRYATFEFQADAQARRRRHVAGLVRPDRADPDRGGPDRGAREEGGELRAELAPRDPGRSPSQPPRARSRLDGPGHCCRDIVPHGIEADVERRRGDGDPGSTVPATVP